MKNACHQLVTVALIVVLTMPGCLMRRHEPEVAFDPGLAHFQEYTAKIEYPDVQSETVEDTAATPAPWTVNSSNPEYWDLSLEEAIQSALHHSQVLRDLGGLVLESPQRVATTYDFAIAQTDPRFGVDAALAAFDASFEAEAFFEKNDRALNNVFFGGGTRLMAQDLHHYQVELNKKSATGADFAVRHSIDYDYNNQPGNFSPNLPWLVQLEGEFRQPLLQGAGVDFNRIAGPNAQPGAMNGVVLARINTDISLTDFEIGVRNLVNDVETAYWELYFAYRDLDAKIAARDQALETWRQINVLKESGRRGGLEEEASAREQYFRLEEEVQNALSGRMQDRMRLTTLRGQGGIQAVERRLRLLMGVSINDGHLIRPSDNPSMAHVRFTWDEILMESLCRREEIRRQKWQIKKRELELVASRNFLLPRVDAIGRYRWRGLGHDLIDDDRLPIRFNNAYQDLTSGDFQEWQMGIEMTMPVGFRRGHAGVRNAELLLARDKAMLEQIERDIAHDLSAAYAEVERAYLTSQTNYNRRQASREHLKALKVRFDEEVDVQDRSQLLDLLLDAQRRLADAETAYYRSLLEYALAVKSVHYQKGSLLEFNQVFLAEGPWPGKAYVDAAVREQFKHPPAPLMNYIIAAPSPVAAGELEQSLAPADLPEPVELPEAERVLTPPTPLLDQAATPRGPQPVTIEEAGGGDFIPSEPIGPPATPVAPASIPVRTRMIFSSSPDGKAADIAPPSLVVPASANTIITGWPD